MVRVELLTQLESIENRLYDKLMDCSARKARCGSSQWETWCLNELEVGNFYKGGIERLEEKVEAVTSKL